MLVASVVVIPGVIYGALAVANSRAALARASGLQLVGEARNAADGLATALRSEREALTSAAQQDVMREIRIGDLDKRISSFLGSLQGGCPSCLDLLVLDATDKVVAASTPMLIGRVLDPHLGTPAGASIHGPLDDPDHRRPSLRLSVPIPDPEAPTKLLGRVIALLDWERVTEMTARTRANLVGAGIDADVLVIDEHATVIGGAPRRASRWHRGDALGLTAWSGREPEPAARIDDAADVLIGRAQLPDDLPPWTILVAQPLSEAFAPVRRMAGLLGGTLAVMLVLALAAALAAARRATRPLAELTAAAAEIGRGEPVPPIPIRSGDEIGTLGRRVQSHGRGPRARRAPTSSTRRSSRSSASWPRASPTRYARHSASSAAHPTPRAFAARSRRARRSSSCACCATRSIASKGWCRACSSSADHASFGSRPRCSGRSSGARRISSRCKRATRASPSSAAPVDAEPWSRCDPEHVYQVVLNLLVNALQILPPGGRIDVRDCSPAHDGRAGFEVRDDGPGIPPDLRATLVQPFFTRREGGTGLGSTFVQRVVLAHQGRLTVDSTRGARRGLSCRASRRGGRVMKRVLVVDDDATMRRVAADHARADGARVRRGVPRAARTRSRCFRARADRPRDHRPAKCRGWAASSCSASCGRSTPRCR